MSTDTGHLSKADTNPDLRHERAVRTVLTRLRVEIQLAELLGLDAEAEVREILKSKNEDRA